MDLLLNPGKYVFVGEKYFANMPVVDHKTAVSSLGKIDDYIKVQQMYPELDDFSSEIGEDGKKKSKFLILSTLLNKKGNRGIIKAYILGAKNTDPKDTRKRIMAINTKTETPVKDFSELMEKLQKYDPTIKYQEPINDILDRAFANDRDPGLLYFKFFDSDLKPVPLKGYNDGSLSTSEYFVNASLHGTIPVNVGLIKISNDFNKEYGSVVVGENRLVNYQEYRSSDQYDKTKPYGSYFGQGLEMIPFASVPTNSKNTKTRLYPNREDVIVVTDVNELNAVLVKLRAEEVERRVELGFEIPVADFSKSNDSEPEMKR